MRQLWLQLTLICLTGIFSGCGVLKVAFEPLASLISEPAPGPSISINNVTVNEGDGTATLNVSLSGVPTSAVSVEYQTADVTAFAGDDYTAASGTLNWDAGDGADKTIAITIIDDAVVDPNETFRVVLKSPSGATLSENAIGTVTIVDNDGPPSAVITKRIGQANLTNTLPVQFTATFSREITTASFTSADISNTGTATGVTWTVTKVSALVYTIAATVSGDGTLVPEIAANSIVDLALNTNPTSATSSDTVTYDSSAPSAPTNVDLQDPASSPGTDTTPVIRVTGASVGDTVRLYSDNACSTLVTSAVVSSGTSVDITLSALTSGTYEFYATSADPARNESVCSTDHADYILDVTNPNPITSVTLSSDAQAGVSNSTTTSPDLTIVAPGTDVGTGVAAFEYQLVRTTDSATIVNWTSFGAGVSITTRFTGLTLAGAETYRFRIRVKDGAGNVSSVVDSNTFTVAVVTTPYDGLGLADPTTLTDFALSSSTINGSTYTRTAPREGKAITVSGTNTWTSRAAIFLRGDSIHFNNGAVISANGANGVASSSNNGGAGGNGGSGGGGGQGSSGAAAFGGAGGSGGNGSAGTADGATAGTAGAGTASTYATGFVYGEGGAGAAGGTGANGGAGGAAFNGAGGGGGGGGRATGGAGGDGGGGGGGLVVIVANSITGSGLITVMGGNGANSGLGIAGGGGGGGVIWIAAKAYSGNLLANVSGGSGSANGGAGTVKIYQINSDGSLTRRSLNESWGVDGPATTRALPYSSGLADVTTLSDDTLNNSTIDSSLYTVSNPYSAKTLSVSGTLAPTSASTALFLRVDTLSLTSGAVISANGSDGATTPAGWHDGGAGGRGGSGGGGGSSGGGTNYGGAGGSGSDGVVGTTSWAPGGPGGVGSAPAYSIGFTWGMGGAGGSSDTRAPVSNGGAGSNGAGGGGGGGGTTDYGAAGGGGGGGLIAIVANTVTGNGLVQAFGGNGGSYMPGKPSAGGGGGGVIWIAAKNYDGNLTFDVNGGRGGTSAQNGSAGTVTIYQMYSDGRLVARSPSQRWTLDSAPLDNDTPYSHSVLTGLSGLSDQTLADGATLDAATYSRRNPYAANNLTIAGLVKPANNTPHAVFLAANNLILNPGARISASGTDANLETAGSGGSGGGAGGGCGTGGMGGSGSDGAYIDNDYAGKGTAFVYNGGFSYGLGGNGGVGATSAGYFQDSGSWFGVLAAGSGVNGAGGGGGGINSCSGISGGGGGGGGLVVIVANNVSGGGIVEANGGKGGLGETALGGGGGGGVVWIAAKNYSGNLRASVLGGFGGTHGANGTARIFQLYSNGTVVARDFNDTWTLDSAPVPSNLLPFSSAVLANLASASDGSSGTTTINGSIYRIANPYAVRDFTVNGTLSYDTSGDAAVFLAARNLTFSSGTVSANGQNAVNQQGGNGASGGGSGSGCAVSGAGGSGGNGFGATPGTGVGRYYAYGFTFGSGGAGGNGGSYNGGAGGNGYGGGGGAQNGCSGTHGAGGGGGGLVVIVADSISGTGTIEAIGGNGSVESDSTGSGGGGGVIWIATKSYSGGLTAVVTGGTGLNAGSSGTASIFKLEADGSLTPKTFADTW